MKKASEVIDKKTIFDLKVGELYHWETTVPCSMDYLFDNMYIHMMLKGEKKVHIENKELNFSSKKVILTPTCKDITVDIDAASNKLPVECASLVISEEFMENFYWELCEKYKLDWDNLGIDNRAISNSPANFELSSMLTSYEKLYKLRTSYENSYNQQFLIENNLKELLYILYTSNIGSQIINSVILDSEEGWLNKVVNFVKRNIKEDLSIPQLAKISGKSESLFYSKFRDSIGMTPNQFINIERLKHAQYLLANSNYPVKNISFECGFNSVEHFSRIFKSYSKLTPVNYRKQHSNLL